MPTNRLVGIADPTATKTGPEGEILYFGEPRAEYEAARNGLAIADLSERGRVEVGGDDRVKFLNNLSTNDIPKIAVGGGAEAFFLDARGRILDYAALFCLPRSIWIDTEPGRASLLVKHLDKYLIREKVTLTDKSPETAQFHLAGPKAPALVSRATESECPELANLEHMERTIGGRTCQVRCYARSLGGGFDIVVSSENATDVAGRLWSLGSELGITAIGQETLELLRVEAGLPRYGVDISETNFPQEMNRDEQAISFTKGCYIGQETVARIDSYGHVNRILRGVALKEPTDLTLPVALQAGSKEAGSLTSLTLLPGKPGMIGLAILRKGSDMPGTKLQVNGVSTEAVVCELPFTDIPES